MMMIMILAELKIIINDYGDDDFTCVHFSLSWLALCELCPSRKFAPQPDDGESESDDSLLNLMIVEVKVMIVIKCHEDDNCGSSFYLLDPTCELSVIQIPLDKGEEEPGNSI